MRRYETTYILRPNLGEGKFTEIIERTNAIITDDGGTIINVDRWGLRKLAYEIKKEKQGYYVYFDYAAKPSAVKEMERIFRIDDQVLRYLTIKLADSIDEESVGREVERFSATPAAPEEGEEQEAAETAAPETAEDEAPQETPATEDESKSETEE